MTQLTASGTIILLVTNTVITAEGDIEDKRADGGPEDCGFHLRFALLYPK